MCRISQVSTYRHSLGNATFTSRVSHSLSRVTVTHLIMNHTHDLPWRAAAAANPLPRMDQADDDELIFLFEQPVPDLQFLYERPVLVREPPPTMRQRECSTCARELGLNQFPHLPAGSACTHDRETCRRCWHQWLDSQVRSVAFDQIKCAQCDNKLGQSDMRALAKASTYQR